MCPLLAFVQLKGDLMFHEIMVALLGWANRHFISLADTMKDSSPPDLELWVMDRRLFEERKNIVLNKIRNSRQFETLLRVLERRGIHVTGKDYIEVINLAYAFGEERHKQEKLRLWYLAQNK